MSFRRFGLLLVSLSIALAGCSSGGADDSSDGTGTASEQETTVPVGPTYTPFDQFPGEEVLLHGDPVGLRVKALDAQWVPEMAGTPAQAGSHYLAVYVALTGQLADRGVQGAVFDRMFMGLRFKTENCNHTLLDDGYCHFDTWPVSSPAQVADNEWRTYSWDSGEYSSLDMEAGETLIAAVGYSIEDTVEVQGDIKFCTSADIYYIDPSGYQCTTVPTPEPRA